MINTKISQQEEVKESKKRKISEILASVVDDTEVSMINTSSSRQPAKRRKLNQPIEKVQKSLTHSRPREVVSKDLPK
jgi:hypothetical protein